MIGGEALKELGGLLVDNTEGQGRRRFCVAPQTITTKNSVALPP